MLIAIWKCFVFGKTWQAQDSFFLSCCHIHSNVGSQSRCTFIVTKLAQVDATTVKFLFKTLPWTTLLSLLGKQFIERCPRHCKAALDCVVDNCIQSLSTAKTRTTPKPTDHPRGTVTCETKAVVTAAAAKKLKRLEVL